MKTGIELIAEERQEQIEKHGWSKDYDKKKHFEGSLVRAACAICYDSELDNPANFSAPDWAWEIREHKQRVYRGHEKEEKISRLKVAGALIAAEIDRLNS